MKPTTGGSRGVVSLLVVGIALVSSTAAAWEQCEPGWLPGEGLPGTNGPVYATVTWDPDGVGPRPPVLVAGGEFSVAGNVLANNIAYWDGVSWHPLGSGMDGAVRALAVLPNNALVAGGDFVTAGDAGVNFIARWDDSSWHALGSGMDDWVQALAVLPNGDLIAGGSFWQAGNVEANYIARWDGLSWYPLGTGMDDRVQALTVLPNGDLIAGGGFWSAGEVEANYIARWDGLSWYPLGAGTDDWVQALTVLPNGDLVAGGDFWTAGEAEANYIARWDGVSWYALGSGMDGWVRALTVIPNGDLIVGGRFMTAGDVMCQNTARWDGSSWHPLAGGMSSTVQTLTVLPTGDLIAGGVPYGDDDYRLARDTTGRTLARWDGSAWHALGSGMNDAVWALTVLPNADVVVGGDFTMAGGVSVNYVARRGGSSWYALGSGMDAAVRALTVLPGGDVVAGGDFAMAGGVSVGYVARWDGLSWHALGIGMDWSVWALAVLPDGDVVAGGSFWGADDMIVNGIARWDGSSWHGLASGMNGTVYALAVLPNGDLIAAGDFTTADDVEADHVARWDGASWHPLGSGTNAGIRALAVLPNGDLIAGGGFTMAGDDSAYFVARWDGSSWYPLGSGMEYVVWALTVLPNGDLIAGGSFWQAGDVDARYVARWDGTSWYPLGSGTNGQVGALTGLPNGDLVAGGDFSIAGGQVSAYWARWGSTGGRGDLVVSSMTVDPTAVGGRPMHAVWDVFNNDPDETACRGFVDALYLSADAQWDIDDLKLGSMVHGTDLGPQSGHAAEMDMIVAGVLPGEYRILLRTDEYNAVEEGDAGEQNNVSASDPVSITIDELILSTPRTDEFTEVERARYYQVTVTDGEDLQVTLDDLDAAGVNELYASYEAIPTRSRFDFHGTSNFAANQVLRVPGTQEGTYYILAYAPPTGLSDVFAITAEYLPFQLLSATPNAGGNAGSVTIRLVGARFAGDMSVSLLPVGGEAHAATTVNVLDSARLDATFDLTDLAPALCDVQVKIGGDVVELPESFAVLPGGGPMLRPMLSIPSITRVGRIGVMHATVTNCGTTDSPVPITWLMVPAGMAVTLDPEEQPNHGSLLLDFTTLDSPAHVLPPATTVQIPVYYTLETTGYFYVSLDIYDWPLYPPNDELVGWTAWGPDPNDPATHSDPQFGALSVLESDPNYWELGSCEFRISGFAYDVSEPSDDFKAALLHGEFPEPTWQYDFSDTFPSPPYDVPGVTGSWLWRSSGHAGASLDVMSNRYQWIQMANDSSLGFGLDPLPGQLYHDMLPFYHEHGVARAFEDDPAWPLLPLGISAVLCRCTTMHTTELEVHAAAQYPDNPKRVLVDKNGVRWGYTLKCTPKASNNTNGGGTGGTGSTDPNFKIGPGGVGSAAYVADHIQLPYTVSFENLASASAAALQVRVTDQLSSVVEWSTIALDEIAFGETVIQVPAELSHYQGRVQMDGWTWNEADGWHRHENGVPVVPLVVDVDAGIDIQTGLMHWTINCLDPNTGNPPEDPYAGFLPPNQESIAYPDPNRPGAIVYPGEGRVTYRVNPKSGLATGTQIVNSATIAFDTNPPIDTPATFNTIDAAAPSSAVLALPVEMASSSFTVQWDGQDDAGGSGVAGFDVYVSTDGAPFAHWHSGPEASAVFQGRGGCSYAFYSIAHDNVGNREASPDAFDTSTLVSLDIPFEPLVRSVTSATAELFVNTPNGPAVEHAVFEEITGQYVGPVGRLQADAFWQPASQWIGVQARALSPSSQHRFKVKARSASGVETEFSPPTEIATTRAGDIDGDDAVTVADLGLVRGVLGTQYGDPAFDARCDLNGDDKVTFVDLGIVRRNLAPGEPLPEPSPQPQAVRQPQPVPKP